MISNELKSATKVAHQQLEKTVVMRLKSIRSKEDYVQFLKHFYAYFHAVEQAVAPYITTEVLHDLADRRNSSYIGRDIAALGGDLNQLPHAEAPHIANVAEALGALYVLEGSIMGGPFIVQMLQKYGIDEGFSFFSGYGPDSGKMWAGFTAVLDRTVATTVQQQAAICKADETFNKFGDVFESKLAQAPEI